MFARARFTSSHQSKRIFVLICVAVVAVHWVVIAHRHTQHPGDFDVSREFGRRLLDHEHLYAGGLNYQYLPIAALSYAPLALFPPGIGIGLRYAAALGCTWLTFSMLHSMVRRRRRTAAAKRWAIAAVALVLGSHYVIRDLDDGGPHLIVLAIAVGGIYCIQVGRPKLGALWLALAAVLKVTPALFIPYFLWKRWWRLATYTSVAAACWIALPMAWMGPAGWWAHHHEWTRVAVGSFIGQPTVGNGMELRIQNQALRPALTRYLGADPPGYPPRPAHSGEMPALDLDPTTARRLATFVTLALLALCAWQARARFPPRSTRELPVECSAVLILAVLLSPLTWVQHLVFALPALYFIAAEHLAIRKLGSAATAAMVSYAVMALLLNREILGKDIYFLLLGCGMHTICMLLVLGVIVLRCPTAAAEAASSPPAPSESAPR